MESVQITNPAQAVGLAKDKFNGLDHEELWAMYVGLDNMPTAFVRLSSGGWTSTTIDLRQIFSNDMEGCTGVVLERYAMVLFQTALI
ncbi:MAG: hypothetical protein J5737_01410 [Bacteroidales bacterium]|nr:hypothetical protein [Bacteroidales bacterium]